MVDGMIQRFDRATGRLLTTSFADLAYDLSPFLPSNEDGGRSTRELSTLELLTPTPALAEETGQEEAVLYAEGHGRIAEALFAPVAALIALGTMLLGQFSRFGVWRQTIAAVVLAILVKGVESTASQAVDRDPPLWPLAYLSAATGFAAAAALLWIAARPRRVRREVRP
jgi:lipopolysaccharide export system permease protein